MCLGDWRLGRLITSVPRSVSISPIVELILPKNPNRVGLVITSLAQFQLSSTITGAVDLVTGGVNLVQTQTQDQILSVSVDDIPVYNVSLFNTVLSFSYANDGDLPSRKFTLATAGSAMNAGVIEHFLPADVIASALEELRSSYKWQRP